MIKIKVELKKSPKFLAQEMASALTSGDTELQKVIRFHMNTRLTRAERVVYSRALDYYLSMER